MTYETLFANWKIIFDYCCWVRDGGEAMYGDITVAEAWCTNLMVAMSAVTG